MNKEQLQAETYDATLMILLALLFVVGSVWVFISAIKLIMEFFQ